MTTMNPKALAHLMWEVVGHTGGHDEAGKCSKCGAVLSEFVSRVEKQGAAHQADCCDGFVLRGSQERKDA